MAEFIRRVYEDGKITIPKEIRDLEAIQPGDFVRVTVDVVRRERADPPQKREVR